MMAAAATAERSRLLEKAAASLSRGDFDAALKQYVRIFDDDPHDWSVGNTLGDLYIRMGRADDAVSHFTVLAEQLAADGFAAKARALYRKILRLQPDSEMARQRVDELDRQQVGTASPFFKRVLETARAQRETALPPPAQEPPPVMPEPPTLTPAPAAQPSPAASALPPSFWQIEAPVNEAVARHAWAEAAQIIERFLTVEPGHVGALERLIDVCVDGGLDVPLLQAQQRLADVCERGGELRRAFDITVDLCARDPRSTAHHERLGRVAAAGRARGQVFDIPFLPEPEPEIVVPAPAAPASVAGRAAPPRVVERPAPPAPPPVAAPAPPPVAARPAPVAAPPRPVSAPPPQPIVPPAADVRTAAIAIGPPLGDLLKACGDPERLLEDTRQAFLEDAGAAAEEGYAQASRLLAARQPREALAPLEDAMCLPHLRASAGARLARVHRDVGDPVTALEVLEWVAEMPPADEESGHELAYELALTLEALGQDSQALGVYRELLAEVGPTYRDVATRADRLTAA